MSGHFDRQDLARFRHLLKMISDRVFQSLFTEYGISELQNFKEGTTRQEKREKNRETVTAHSFLLRFCYRPMRMQRKAEKKGTNSTEAKYDNLFY